MLKSLKNRGIFRVPGREPLSTGQAGKRVLEIDDSGVKTLRGIAIFPCDDGLLGGQGRDL